MGKRSSRHKLTTAEKAEISQHINKVVEALSEQMFTLEAPMTMTVRRKDASYRKLSIGANSEFFLTDAYIGASDKLILCLSPVEVSILEEGRNDEIESVEVQMDKMDETFPLFGVWMRDAMGVETESEKAVEVFDALRRKAEVAREKELVEAHRSLATNPLFGMF